MKHTLFEVDLAPDTLHVAKIEDTVIAAMGCDAVRTTLELPANWTEVVIAAVDEYGVDYPLTFDESAVIDPSCRMGNYRGDIEQRKVFGPRLFGLDSMEWLTQAYNSTILDFMRQHYDKTVIPYQDPESMGHIIETFTLGGETHVDHSDGNFNLYVLTEPSAYGGGLEVWADPMVEDPRNNTSSRLVVPTHNGSASMLGNSLDEARRLAHGADGVLGGRRIAINLNFETAANADRDRAAINAWDGNAA